jgi:WD40 repeat protein
MLFRGARLAQSSEWASAHPDDMNALEREFLATSIEAAESEAQEREERRLRELEAARRLAEVERERAEVETRRAEEQLRAAGQLRKRAVYLAGAFSAAMLMAVVAFFFWDQSRQSAVAALEQERIASSRELAVQARLNLTADPERSILLALAALDQAYTLEGENVLHEAVSASRVRLALEGHEGAINRLDYSPNGERIASAGEDGTVRLWNASKGDELLSLPHPDAVTDLDFSPDGQRLATGAADGFIRLWDVASGEELVTIAASGDGNATPLDMDVAFSANGKQLATANNSESAVRFWDPATGESLFSISGDDWLDVSPGIDLIPDGIALSPNGTLLAINLTSKGLSLGRTEVWDLRTRQRVQVLGENFDPEHDPAFNPDGTQLAVPNGPDGLATVWDIVSGDLQYALDEGVNTIQYSADGDRLIAASGGGRVKVFDAETGEEILVLVGHTGRVYKLAESPGCVRPPAAPFEWCGTRLATAGDDGTVRVWDVSPQGNQELLALPGLDSAVDPDGTRLSTIAFSSGEGLGLADSGGSVTLQPWELPDGLQPGQVRGFQPSSIEIGNGFRQSWFFPEEGIFTAAYDSSPLRFWDVATGEMMWSMSSCCPWTEGMGLAFSGNPEPRAAVLDPRSGLVKVWDPSTDNEIQSLQAAGPNELASSLRVSSPAILSPDGSRLAVLKDDTTVETWDVETGAKLLTLPGPAVLEGAGLWYSPSGEWLMIGDCTGSLVLRDAETGEEISSFISGAACISDVAISPSGAELAVSSAQQELKIWDLKTGQELLTLPGGTSVQFTADGTRLVVARWDDSAPYRSTVNVYLLELEDLISLARSRLTRALTAEECQKYLHVERCSGF